MTANQQVLDVVVIGAGPAGLMAAGQAALAGHDVMLLEKQQKTAMKLRITGKGRCNLTNTASRSDFAGHFGRQGRFLNTAFGRFFSDELLDFFHQLGVETQVERGGRVFPKSNDAHEVADRLTQWAKTQGVHIRLGTRVKGIEKGNEFRIQIQSSQKAETLFSKSVIIATGGKSYPGTGSTGDGYQWAADLGHTLTSIRPALIPLVTEGDCARKLQGLSLRNAGVSLWIDGKKACSMMGELMFTHFGLSGPVILTLSKTAVEALACQKQVAAEIDLKPALDAEKVDKRLLREIETHPKQQLKSMLKSLLPQKMISYCMESLNLNPVKPLHSMGKNERKALGNWLKRLPFKISGHRPIAEAIVTAGGVNLKEIRSKTMASALCAGLYFAGEVLDLDGDTGGYNLQSAFSTGWLAGNSVLSESQISTEQK